MSDKPKSPVERLLRAILASRFLTISALIHLLIVVLFGGRVLFQRYVEPPDFEAPPGDSFVQSGNDTPAPPAPAPVDALPPPPSATVAPPPPATPQTAALTTIATMNATSTSFNVPMPTLAPPTMSKDLTAAAAPQSFGQGAMPALPGAMAGRGAAGRGAGAKFGERTGAEAAVMKALRWLQSQQQSDGFWPKPFQKSFSGLALLCFLGHGETPETSREFGLVVSKAIDALADYGNAHNCQFCDTNNFAGNDAVYQHAICVYALSEAYTMTKNQKLVPIIQKAAGYILDGQLPAGGWVYNYSKSPAYPTDTSVVGWQIQALKAAHLTGIAGLEKIPGALDKGIQALDSTYNAKNGAYGYHLPGDRDYALTGVGVLCKLFWQGRSDKMVREGIKNIKSRDLDYGSKDANLYAWYYNTQACFQAQGEAWEWWNRRFQDMLVNKQNADGTWPATGGKSIGAFDDDSIKSLLYRTTLCTLMLEVFYRYLPSTKESSGGGNLQGL